ncbi:MAG: sigma-54-dependent Fis family transcriptional regulator, partial [Planctomycetales bacterium]
RLDLYHRLNDYRINLPPLRERDADVELLIQHYLDLLAKQLGKPIDGVSPEAFEMLKQYQWPGNVRELQTVLKKMLLNTTGPVLATEIIPSFLRRAKPTANNSLGDLQLFIDHKQRTGSHNLYAETLEVMERYLITRLLRENDGNQSQTAKALGITRGSLRHKIRALDLAIDHVVHPKHA